MNREAERKRLVELVRQGIDIPCVTDNPWDEEACKDCRWKGDADCHASKIADHLLDNGIVVPPVKANTFAYFFDRNEIKEGYVERIISDKRGTRITVCYDGIQFKIFKPCDFGKTVFLTREEAEKALRKEDEE